MGSQRDPPALSAKHRGVMVTRRMLGSDQGEARPPTTGLAPSPTQTRGVRRVLYKSSALEATAPALAFRRRSSARIALAAAEADECRERYKADRLAAAGMMDIPGESAESRCAKKYKRRLLLNRHSASASRLRKEAYCASLEKHLAQVEQEYNALVQRVKAILGYVPAHVSETAEATLPLLSGPQVPCDAVGAQVTHASGSDIVGNKEHVFVKSRAEEGYCDTTACSGLSAESKMVKAEDMTTLQNAGRTLAVDGYASTAALLPRDPGSSSSAAVVFDDGLNGLNEKYDVAQPGFVPELEYPFFLK